MDQGDIIIDEGFTSVIELQFAQEVDFIGGLRAFKLNPQRNQYQSYCSFYCIKEMLLSSLDARKTCFISKHMLRRFAPVLLTVGLLWKDGNCSCISCVSDVKVQRFFRDKKETRNMLLRFAQLILLSVFIVV